MVAINGTFGRIPDLIAAIEAGWPIFRCQIAPPAASLPPEAPIRDTLPFADKWVQDLQNRVPDGPERDVACYYAMDATVSGSGQVWFGDSLVTSDEVMPKYVADALGLETDDAAQLHAVAKLPLKIVKPACLVALGHGSKVYGHFLIEMLFRLLVSDRAFFNLEKPPYRVLLDFDSPKWLLRILEEHFGIGPADVEFFFPQTERVLLRHAIIPTRIFQSQGAHPFANELLEGFLARLKIESEAQTPRRIFLARGQSQNPASPRRVCLNERNLIEIAARRFGFVAITPEALTWRQQITLFRGAEIAVGQAGSGLHNALFSRPGSRLASIGIMNFVQHHIGSLRQQHLAFLTKDINLKGEFSVNEEVFE